MKTAPASRSQSAVVLLVAITLTLTIAPDAAHAQGTRLWQQNHYDEFERGTTKGIAISSDGRLQLAPAFRTVFTSPSTYIWSVASDSDGNAYIASGAPARVYKVTPTGKASIIFEAKELQVQVLRIGPDGAVYAATSPDGKVYRIAPGKGTGTAQPAPTANKNGETAIPVDASYTSKLFFDPKAKYIWDMVFDAQGRLYIATGDQGSIYRVDRNGEGSLFFKSDEAHFRSLLIAQDGNLIAGTDGSGLIYRITPSAEAFVLYSASKKEITALAQDSAGNLYAAGVGDKHGSGTTSAPVVIAPPTTSGTPASGQTANANAFPLLAAGSGSTAGGSEIYQLAPDGSPRKIWTTRDNLIYCMQVLEGSTLLVGTGNRGRLYTVTPDGRFTDVLKASANQVTQFAVSKNGIYVASANLGKLFLLTPKQYEDGSLESDVFDAESFSQWGRAEVLGSGPFELWARAGNVDNPDRNWSPWKMVDMNNPELNLPAARFAQWKIVMHANKKQAAEVESVGINYRVRNLAPVVDDIAVQPGAHFPMPTGASRGGSESVQVNFGSHESTSEASHASGGESPSTATKDKNWIAVRWAAHDENEDELEYAVYYRGEEETAWKLLKDHIAEKYYSFESAFVPDGAYVIRVVASDAPSHTPQDALTGERVSQRFVVDTTPPRIEQLAGTINGDQVHVTFRAVDSFSPIKRAEYSVDAREWQFVEPASQLSDAPAENYDFNAKLHTVAADVPTSKNNKKNVNTTGAPEISGEHVVVVRVYDRYDNMSTAKIVVKP